MVSHPKIKYISPNISPNKNADFIFCFKQTKKLFIRFDDFYTLVVLALAKIVILKLYIF